MTREEELEEFIGYMIQQVYDHMNDFHYYPGIYGGYDDHDTRHAFISGVRIMGCALFYHLSEEAWKKGINFNVERSEELLDDELLHRGMKGYPEVRMLIAG